MKSSYLTLIALAVMIFFSEKARAQTCSLPEARIMKSPVYVYDAAADLMTVTVPVGNVGSAALASPFRITVYRDEVGNAKRYTYNYNSVIATGGTANITFGISKFKAEWMPFDTLVIRINDSGNGYNSQQVCDSAYRDYKRVQLVASDDYMLIFNESEDNQFRVAINDILPASYVSLTVNILASPAFTGMASVGGSTIFYTPAAGQSADTLRYRIHCGNAEYADTATIYIKIIDKPENIGDAECFTTPESFSFTMIEQHRIVGGAHIKNIPLVGDLDGDGIPEIVTFGSSANYNQFQRINVFDGKTKALKAQISLTVSNSSWITPTSAVIVDADGDGKGEIIYAHGGKLYAYRANLSENTFSLVSKGWNVSFTYPSSAGNSTLPQPVVTDFNGDGVPELVVYNQIFNANTGALLGTTEAIASAYVGRDASYSAGPGATFVSTADFDGDGLPELIAGAAVYKVNISGNTATCTVLSKNATVGDGFSAVADIDLDGKLEVVIAKLVGSSNSYVHVWRPDIAGHGAGTYKRYEVTANGGGASSCHSFPFIGDIDGAVNANGKKYPEICLMTINAVTALKYNPENDTHSQLWKVSSTDGSGGTGITLFDFNNDGAYELVYRDQDNLRIMDGTNGSNKTYKTCGSGTAWEYPVVADTDGDGSANICIPCYSVPSSTYDLVIFESNSQPWAPAKKVWNQAPYNVVNINENLTVPRYPLNPAIVLPGTDGQLGTSDDVRPYNGFLQQQTILSKNGTQYWEASDYALDGTPSAVYYSVPDSLSISFCVTNYGDIQGTAPFYVSIYKNTRQSGNRIVTKSYPNVPVPGQTICYSLKVENVLGNSDLNSLHLWLNDSGNGTGVNPECDYTNGVVVYDVRGDVAAQNDYASLFTCEAITIPILANDVFSGTTFTIMNTPKYGAAVQSGGALRYTNDGVSSGLSCEQTGNRIDTIHYKIGSIIDSASAYAVVKIYSPPDMMLENACSVSPKIALSSSYDGFTYDWEYSPDGASGWQFVATNSESTKLNFTGKGFYRVTINYDGNKTYRLKKGIEVTVNRTTQLPGGIVWYDTSFNTVNISWQ
jgi:hypothetical protein